MPEDSDHNGPVKAKAVLIDPVSMTAVWMNEAAAQDVRDTDLVLPLAVEQAAPLAESMGAPDALRAVAETGVAQHLRANLVSTAQGDMLIVTSIYRLPDGKLLMLTENAWQPTTRPAGDGGGRRSGRRAR